jgi:hypothetical protein
MPVLPRFHNPHNEGVEESFRQSSGGESASFTPSNDGMKFLSTKPPFVAILWSNFLQQPLLP